VSAGKAGTLLAGAFTHGTEPSGLSLTGRITRGGLVEEPEPPGAAAFCPQPARITVLVTPDHGNGHPSSAAPFGYSHRAPPVRSPGLAM
jgi:hypothetical protein